MNFYKYRLLCSTEGVHKFVTLESTEPAPTTCPTDTGHTIDANSVSIDSQYSDQRVTTADGVQVVEITPITQGYGDIDSAVVISHDFGDRSTWYQKSVQVVNEVLSDSGNGLKFLSVNPNWIDIHSLRLTADHNSLWDRDGSLSPHSKWEVVVKVDDVVQVSGYEVDHVSGFIEFDDDHSGDEIKVSYSHSNGVDNPSEWLLVPPVGKKLIVEHVEMQFSKNIEFQSELWLEVWAGASVSGYGDFNEDLYAAGYGQIRTMVKSLRDVINICQKGVGWIPACGSGSGELTRDTLVFPYEYLKSASLNSSYGMVLRLFSKDNKLVLNTDLATIAFYMMIKSE